jgi:PLP dependent protein
MTEQPAPPQRRLLASVDVDLVGQRLATLRDALTTAAQAAGRAQAPEVLVASKYFEPQAIPALVAAGATLLGENRADVLAAKQATISPGAAQWDYIGELQSRKVKDLVGHVARIHTVASPSAVRKLQALSEAGAELPALLVQVNVAGEDGKGGIGPSELPGLLEAAQGLPVRGLMTMPPLAAGPSDSRRWFAALRELADVHGLVDLSMGTSQDAIVAAEEGATVVRVGGLLTSDDAWARLFPAS